MSGPAGTLDPRYSSPGAAPVPWAQARAELERAELFWITTVRPDGRPHVTPLIAVWLDGALHVTTGAHEQKARNLAADPRCAVLTGRNTMAGGLDVVVEGSAERVTDHRLLERLAEAWVAKYGEEWRFVAHDGAFHHPGADGEGVASLVFAVVPDAAYGFGKGEEFSQTRWAIGDRERAG